MHCLSSRGSIGVLASEENENPMIVHEGSDEANTVVFDPLDGSSNIDVNVSVGTTFSILRKPDKVTETTRGMGRNPEASRLPPIKWSTDPPPYWSTAPVTGCVSLWIPPSEPTS